MRILEVNVQTGTETIEEQIPILDENGNETGEFEAITKEVPVFENRYRNATPEEEAEYLRQQAEFEEAEKHRMPTTEERMDSLEDAFAELCKEVFS